MLELKKVYDLEKDIVGKKIGGYTLLPIYHSTQKAQIDVVIYSDSTFASASEIAEDESVTIIPVTEDSAARSSGIAPHPLHDKLIYVAGDYSDYVKGKSDKNEKYFDEYILGLLAWADSDYSDRLVRIICGYLKQGTLIKDLVEKAGILKLDADKRYLDEKYKIAKINQAECFIRFSVKDIETGKTEKPWECGRLYDCFIGYCDSKFSEVDLCYVTGEVLPVTYKHVSKIRNAGDKAKLISSNDKANFTYRGRFASDREAYSVSRKVSQEAHLALRWLIERQSTGIKDAKYIFWESELNNVALPGESLYTEADDFPFFDNEFSFKEETEAIPKTNEQFGRRVCMKFKGYRSKLKNDSKVMFACVDAATPGRLALVQYQEFGASDYYDRLECWYKSVLWHGFYFKNDKKIYTDYYTPTPYEIAKYAYGIERSGKVEADNKVLNIVFRQIYSCILFGTPIPENIIKMLYDRCSNPQKYSVNNWNKLTDISCALFRKYYIDKIGVEFNLAVDNNCDDRSYLYGRLAAIADKMECDTFDLNEARLTNAKRYMSAMVNAPFKTWGYLYERVLPYADKIIKKNSRFYSNYEKLLSEILTKFKPGEYESNKRLDARFFLGFYSQRQDFYTSNKKTTEVE